MQGNRRREIITIRTVTSEMGNTKTIKKTMEPKVVSLKYSTKFMNL